MGLPKLATKTYETTLPYLGKVVEYRPYLVKEERGLLMANQSDDPNETLLATLNLVDACVLTEGITARGLVNVDLEWVFLQIRSKSVSEDVEFTQKCQKCEKDFDVKFNLDNVTVKTGDSFSLEYIVKEHDDMKIIFKLPTTKDIMKLSNLKDDGTDNATAVLAVIENAIYQIQDKEKTYTKGQDFEESDVTEFFDQLRSEHLEKIYETVFEAAPKLSQTFTATCKHCKHEEEYTVEGLANFFD